MDRGHIEAVPEPDSATLASAAPGALLLRARRLRR
jgi:hypothetical protein